MTPFRRSHTRFVLLALIAVMAAAVAAGLAFAKTDASAIGSGVVVINTNLAYDGGQAAGTGMVVTSSGEVLTNNHVIRGATTIRIVVPGTGRSYTARVLGYDVADDVALLQVSGASHLKTVSLGNSATVKVGQSVSGLGNAGGSGSLSSASGRVRGTGRAITVSDEQGGDTHRLTGLIETSAALEPGDSGGPLLSAAGKVIGIDTAASVGFGFQQMASSGGYAIPINKAITIVKRIESGSSSSAVHVGGTALLGVQVVANDFDGSGAAVANVMSRSPAAAAGIVPGDVITSFAGHSVSSPSGLSAIVTTEKPGRRVSVTYTDQVGTTRTTTVALASGPPQ